MKKGHSYLIKRWTSDGDQLSKISCVEITQTSYKIQYESKATSWTTIESFNNNYTIIEDLGENTQLVQEMGFAEMSKKNPEELRHIKNTQPEVYRSMVIREYGVDPVNGERV